MRKPYGLQFPILAAVLLVASPAFAQSATQTNPATGEPVGQATNPATGEPTAPATNPATGETATPSEGATTTNAPDSSEAPASPVFTAPTESNRLDPSAPSDLRTQIDQSGVGSQTNPGEFSSDPNAPGLPYNSLAQTSPTTSPGLGVTPTPSPNSPSVYPTPLPSPRPTNTFGSTFGTTPSSSTFGNTNRGFSSPGFSSGSRSMSGGRR